MIMVLQRYCSGQQPSVPVSTEFIETEYKDEVCDALNAFMSACYDHGTSEILFRTTTFCPESTEFIETEYKDEVCDALNAFMSACYDHGTSEILFRTTTFCPSKY